MKNFFLLLLSIAIISCSDDPLNDQAVNNVNVPNIDSLNQIIEQVLNESRLTGPCNLKSTIIATDWSGLVTINIEMASVYNPHHCASDVTVPADYVLIGGGAFIETGSGYGNPGALITASYPDYNLSTWHARSKDHLTPFAHSLVCYAIGLKIEGMTRDQLKQYVRIFETTSGSGHYPNTYANVANGYVLLGGGARTNWSGAGSLLVKSYPSGKSWYAQGKDHGASDIATITAFAIGIRPILPSLTLEVGIESNSNWTSWSYGATSVSVDNSWVISCPGGYSQYNGYGRMLSSIIPNTNGKAVTVISKDHGSKDSGTTYAYAVKIRKKQ